MAVYVISKNGNPLMPCSNAIARLLLKDGKAKVKYRTPFTIKLLYDTTEYTQPITLGIDTGSSEIGSAAVADNGDVLYLSEITIRNDISKKMKQRAMYRKNRRGRKTRYRPARWLNRKNSIKKDRFSPTMVSKFHSHEKEIAFVKSLLPITDLILETATFDPHALKNPEVLKHKWLYQKGANYGFANVKAFVLNRDSYTCQNCKGKSKEKRVEVHHIVFRSNGGSDEPENLITLCKACHDGVHKGELKLKSGRVKGQLKHATQMNSIRIQLLKRLPDAKETFGYVTKVHRELMGLPKEHYNDAIAIANLNNLEKDGVLTTKMKCSLLRKRCISQGDYRQTRGSHSEQKLPTGKIKGFRKFDKVLYNSKEYFIKSRMSKGGYAELMTIDNIKIHMKPIPKLDNMKRLVTRKLWIMK